MQTLTASKLLGGVVFPEGPRWRDGKLWFADMWGNKVITVDERGREEVVVEVNGPAGLGFLPDGRLLVSTRRSSELLRLDEDGLHRVAHLKEFAALGLNDMVVDGHGRAYVDAYNPGNGLPKGPVLLVTPDGKARAVTPALAAPNGLAITPDGKTLIAAEMAATRLLAFVIEPDGSLTNQRTWAKLDGKPDGICLDAEGAVWVGQYEEGRFVRVREGGEVTHCVVMPGAWTTAPMLGGKDRKTLFLCAAVTTRDDLVLRGKADGSISTVRVSVPGAGWP